MANEGIDPDKDIVYACYSGKAVQVLIDKGNTNAITLHKLLYDAIPMSDGTFYFDPKPPHSLPYKVIICDEVSMVPEEFIELLALQDAYFLFMGDPGQLDPPKGQRNGLLDYPHVFLEDIMRQAQDSGIIQLSMLIREGKSFKNFKSEEAMALPQKELVTGALLWADEILCSTNATRININSQIRELKGYTKPIEENEKLICLNNEWDISSNKANALTNGTVGTLKNVFESFQRYPNYLQVKNNYIPTICGVFDSDNGDCFGNLVLDKHCILTGEPYIDDKTRYKINKNKKYHNTIPLSFTYAYCLTAWKAQGSEWDKILGIEEGFPWDRKEHKKYLYTLVTRASKKVVLYTKD